MRDDMARVIVERPRIRAQWTTSFSNMCGIICVILLR
jgi:hypothetical protein